MISATDAPAPSVILPSRDSQRSTIVPSVWRNTRAWIGSTCASSMHTALEDERPRLRPCWRNTSCGDSPDCSTSSVNSMLEEEEDPDVRFVDMHHFRSEEHTSELQSRQ